MWPNSSQSRAASSVTRRQSGWRSWPRWGLQRETDPQPSRIGADPGEKRTGGRGRVVGSSRIGTGGGVQQEGRIPDGQGDRVLGAQTSPAFPPVGSGRGSAAGGLEPEQSAAGGRDPDRPAAVRGVGERDHPGGYQSRRTAAGTAGNQSRVPRIAGRSSPAGLGGEIAAQLWSFCLAEDHQSGRSVSPHGFGVVVGH